MMTRLFLLCSLVLGISLQAQTPPIAPPRPQGKEGKRIAQIESDFGLVFTGEFQLRRTDQVEAISYWTFGRKDENAPFGMILIGVRIKSKDSKLATDEQVMDAFASSSIYAKFIKDLQKSTVQATPTPAALRSQW